MMYPNLAEDLVVGQPVLGTRYVFVRRLGHGSFGSALLVHDGLMQRYIVMKVLREVTGPETVARFMREGRFQWGLKHRAIVEVYDIQHLPDGRPYLVMEYVEGSNLRDHIRDHGRLPMLQALMMAAELFDGLQVAHEASIVHRDIKPGNILVSRDGLLKIVDFGLAKRQAGESGAPLTAEGAILGTPGYCAPEQISGARDVTPAADVFSAGCVLFKMLTGRDAFEGATPMDRYNAVLIGVAPKLHDALQDRAISPALEALQQRLLARDPTTRPKAADAAAELRRLAREFPTVVRPMSPYGEAGFDEATLAVENPKLIFEMATRANGASPPPETSSGTTQPNRQYPDEAATRDDPRLAVEPSAISYRTGEAMPAPAEVAPSRRSRLLVPAMIVLLLLVGGGSLIVGLRGTNIVPTRVAPPEVRTTSSSSAAPVAAPSMTASSPGAAITESTNALSPQATIAPSSSSPPPKKTASSGKGTSSAIPSTTTAGPKPTTKPIDDDQMY